MAGMQPSDIGALVTAGEVRLSPDAALVAFTVARVDLDANTYRSAVWVGPTDGAAPPAPFTAGADGDSTPRWSPDGRWLAFVSHRADKGSTIHVAPVGAGGEVRQVASWPEQVDALEWSPDGARLAFGARLADDDRKDPDPTAHPARRITRLFTRLDSVGWLQGRPRHLFVVPADGTAAPAQVTEGDWGTSGLAWSPDSTTLAFTAGWHDRWDLDLCTDVWVVPAIGGEARRLTGTDADHSLPSFSPDGSLLACAKGHPTDPGNQQVGVLPVGGGEVRVITEHLDRPVQVSAGRSPLWLPDGLLVSVEDHGNVHLRVVAPDGAVRAVVGGERTVLAYDAAAHLVAASVTTATHQAEVVVCDPAAGTERVLTRLGAAFAARVETSAPERFTATSKDGTEVEGWFLPPVGPVDGRAPVLVNVHGGPHTQYGNRFFDEFQVQAGAGYAVVYCNPRGSSGYGNAWSRAVCWPDHPRHPGSGWGGVDAEDVEAVVEEACRRFSAVVDPERVGLLGGSYGGYMTSWLVSHGDRFKAACSERAANDLTTLEIGSSDVATCFSGYSGTDPLTNPAAYADRSPRTFVDRITTPLLIIHSEGDQRCPIDQADAFFAALRLRERDVEYLRYPGESHELSRAGSPKHRVQRAEAILDWFARKL